MSKRKTGEPVKAPRIDARTEATERELRKKREELQQVAPGSEAARRLEKSIAIREQNLAKQQRLREEQEGQASNYLTKYVDENRNKLVAKYWPLMAPEEQRDAAREILEGRRDPFVTQLLLAYAANDLNTRTTRRRRINAPPMDLGMSRPLPLAPPSEAAARLERAKAAQERSLGRTRSRSL